MGRSIILVVDANNDNLKLFQNSLGDDYEVFCASTGRDAMDLVRAKMPAAAFIAYSLPDITGLKLLQILKNSTPLLPAIITADSPSKELILNVLRSDAKDLLEMPFERDELVKIVQRVCNPAPFNIMPRPPAPGFSDLPKKQSFGVRAKDLVVRFLGKKKQGQYFRKDNENELAHGSSEQILKTVSDEEESIIIEKMTMDVPEESDSRSHSKSELKGFFLGNFYLELNNQIIHHWSSHKGKEILAYLLYHHKKRIYRDQLMAKFWPDSPQDCAKNSLNVALHGIRKMFNEIDPGIDYILFKDECYFFNPEIDIWLDLEKFLSHWKIGRSKDQSGDIPAMLEEYKHAVSLYKGDFIEEDLYVDWVNLERENLLEIYLTILSRLSYYYSLNSKPRTAITLCERILSKDKCREDIHRRLIKCYYRLGQRDKAIKQFQKCVAILNSELDVGPTQATLKLYQKVKNETLLLKNNKKLRLSEN
jgi:two-component SAPR family response regulator